ncbi:hypothetical protein AB0I61_17765 [Polymorphospora rubra]|uniref:hypothetical protein n=1 Tax=Polymorphospora rubra TaxID=338584 RepID=UPI0033FDED95
MKRLLTPAWIARHVGAVALVAAFSALGWWQISRAVAGNTLSWAYAVEWPVFAGFVIFVWVREVRHTLRGGQPAEGDAADTPGEPAEAVRPLAATGVAGPGPAADGGGLGNAAGAPGIRRPVRATRRTTVVDEDPELDEYNRYLAWRTANPDARISDYPG